MLWCLSSGDFSVSINHAIYITYLASYCKEDRRYIYLYTWIYKYKEKVGGCIHIFVYLENPRFLFCLPLLSLFYCLDCSGFGKWKLLSVGSLPSGTVRRSAFILYVQCFSPCWAVSPRSPGSLSSVVCKEPRSAGGALRAAGMAGPQGTSVGRARKCLSRAPACLCTYEKARCRPAPRGSRSRA